MFGDRLYLIASVVLIVLAIVIFVRSFERKKPGTKDVVLLSVMISLGVVGRLVFFMVPQFKPCAAIVIITGIMLGKQAGFLSGVMTAFISDMFFGMGPWTLWQMIGFGLIGLISAIIFNKERIEKMGGFAKLILCTYGFLVTFLLYGLLMDTATVFMVTDKPKLSTFIATYSAGIVFNMIHGISTFIFLYLMANPLSKKIKRVLVKYGNR
ncbi:MAG TPA: ECF transporter S component [Eubacterium sp.]|nr:ECF transporter S component [Eubacterium sp.]